MLGRVRSCVHAHARRSRSSLHPILSNIGRKPADASRPARFRAQAGEHTQQNSHRSHVRMIAYSQVRKFGCSHVLFFFYPKGLGSEDSESTPHDSLTSVTNESPAVLNVTLSALSGFIRVIAGKLGRKDDTQRIKGLTPAHNPTYLKERIKSSALSAAVSSA